MVISDISVRRPVFASVLSMLLVAFGLLCFDRLPLREYPAIDPPVVSIDTNYAGAAANVVETRITEVIEKRIAGIEGVRRGTRVKERNRAEREAFDAEQQRDTKASDGATAASA